ncbi:MAG: hypothetical protein EBY22_16210, partial [Gammaproteobacteria bacterium]|nr:hypothetical protein [Gammaproteobacteria bacterium]
QNALTNGKSIIFTPGIYQITNTLKVTNSNTTIYGLGFATLIPAQNFTGPLITVVDAVDGVKIEGLILDAGSISSNTLLQIGDVKSQSHKNNPSILYDVFCRVGGETDGTAKNCITINSNDVIGDDIWIWRADHDNNGQVLWNQNLSDTGLIVNGDNVTMYGLAVEHFQKIQTIWDGENGTTYFYQSEIPYHMPQSFTGSASYEVGATVKVHHAYGLGVYMFLNDNSNAVIPSAIETPNASGIQFTDMDVVIVATAEDFAESVLVTALLKKQLNYSPNDCLEGLVVTRTQNKALIESDKGDLTLSSIRPDLESLVVGDRVLWARDAEAQGVVMSVLPRQTELGRTDRYHHYKILAANITQMVVVIAPKPEPQTLLLDSYCVAAELNGLKVATTRHCGVVHDRWSKPPELY